MSIKETFGSNLENRQVCVTIVDDSEDKFFENIVSQIPVPNIEYIQNVHRLGLEGNFNRCLELTRGQYTIFMGCDDYFVPGFYEEFCRAKQKPAQIYALGVKVVDKFGEQSRNLVDFSKYLLTPGLFRAKEVIGEGDSLLAKLLIGNFLYFPSLVWETNALKRFSFDKNSGVVVDLELISRMLLDGSKILIVRNPKVFAYRRHLGSESSIQKFTSARFRAEKTLSYQVSSKSRGLRWWKSYIFGRILLTPRIHFVISRLQALTQRKLDS